MKLMIASDIHGSAFWCRKLLGRFEDEAAERLVLLGDLLYHGPRNDLPDEYDPKAVLRMLKEMSDRILCVRGNCDSEVDQMVLNFPILAEYAVLFTDGLTLYCVHGHKLSGNGIEYLRPGDILLQGHTHIPQCAESEGFLRLNPGSVSIPKQDSPHGYMTLENGVFHWKNLESGEVWQKHRPN